MTANHSVRLASPADQPVVEKLLRAGFGDEECYLRAFFEHVFPHCDTLLSLDSGEIAAMAALIPCEIVQKGQETLPALYLYSLCTLPEYRGRGHARTLLEEAGKRCERVFLHAANDSLFAMYARLGWRPMMYARYVDMPPAIPQTEFQEMDGDEYFRIRELALKNAPHIRWNKHTCRFLKDMLSAYGGDLFIAHEAVLAVEEERDGMLYLGEAFGKEAPRLAAEIALRYSCSNCRLLVPCHPDDPGAFPMAQGIGKEIPDILQISFVFL